ncbi:hypothetical protein [Phaeocystidibacter marisrubri]|uniref:Uncharacterized protein n=1 Tax=Phaeocystidibacter marisrubri TaxID=1577780 RepID=A0A6L3ZDD9_9FLAO|nr:hypothetical protein [Phaeocystidibacter marisrubri]KAB2815233.1 hypothetical protein F8C82_14160 [Phaeocystidibacter marisrubri]GGH71018.1 hypothetical protein GCM10011318_13620 [Phaeocystidibacter marisrubri]
MANGAFISKDEAAEMVNRFKNNTTTVVNTPYGFWYDRSMVDQLFEDNPTATGIRVYTGLDSNNHMKTIIVAVDSHGNNLFGGGTNPCLDQGVCCPPDCGNHQL